MAYNHFTATVTHRLLTLTHKMKVIIAILALVAVAAADVSHILNKSGPEADATILAQETDVAPDQYKFGYQTSNGISGQEAGVLKNVGKEELGISVQGSSSYTSPEGFPIELRYTADEFGYRPEGAHLPTPPAPQPIPDYILRSIKYNAEHQPPPDTLPIRRI